MDLTYPPETVAFREKMQGFLEEHLPADWKGIGALEPSARSAFQTEWRQTLRDARLLAPNWPAEYGGGGLTPLETRHHVRGVRQAAALPPAAPTTSSTSA